MYYNGSKTEPLQQEEADKMIALAADVLLQILLNEAREDNTNGKETSSSVHPLQFSCSG